jgi:uncharacterized protein YhbP (UPF0306 family)
MKLLETENFSFEEAKESLEDICRRNELLALATVSENSEAFNATAFFAFDGEFNFYILNEPDTDHGQNLEKNSSISLSIYDSRQEWSDDKRGLQVFGEAKIEDEEKVSEAFKIYTERFPGLKEYVSKPGELDKIDSEFYIVRPDRIKIFDEPRFGKETWLNLVFDG